MMSTHTPRIICNRCNSTSVYTDGDEYACLTCGNRRDIPVVRKPIVIPATTKPTRRLRGISNKESRRLWRKTRAGKQAQFRYNHSVLGYAAQEHHRNSPKYRETREAWKTRQDLYNLILHPKPKSDCPKGLIGNNGVKCMDPLKCNLKDNECSFACFLEVGEEIDD